MSLGTEFFFNYAQLVESGRLMPALTHTDIHHYKQSNTTIDERTPLHTDGVYYCCWDFYNEPNAIHEKHSVYMRGDLHLEDDGVSSTS